MKITNPSTEETIREFDRMSEDELAGVVNSAVEAQKSWQQTTFDERSGILCDVADRLLASKEEYGRLMAREMGKPLAQGVAEIEKCSWVCNYYAENARDFLDEEYIETDATRSYVTFRPLGTILSIMPWNFPFWQLYRFAAPGLMAGNAVILKHASNVPGCAKAIEEVMHEGGVPADLFRSIIVDSDHVRQVIDHPGIAAVTLTGSTPAGKAVASQAGSAVKKTVLELGGSDPYIILKDADIEQAAETCVTSRLINSGQSCIAAKRFIVVEDIYEEFLERMVEGMRSKTIGDPLDEGTDIGPLARRDLRDDLHRQVRESIERGAECFIGGEIPDREGWFYPPTVLAGVTEGMPAYEEELFGPVAAVIKAGDEDEAVDIANATNFGLGAAIFSGDVEHAEKIAAERLEAGCCFVNDFVKSDPRLPFGGVKESGYGRELSHYGIKEFVNIKTVYVK